MFSRIENRNKTLQKNTPEERSLGDKQHKNEASN